MFVNTLLVFSNGQNANQIKFFNPFSWIKITDILIVVSLLKKESIDRTVRHTVDTYCTMICTHYLLTSIILKCALYIFFPCNTGAMLL